MGSEVEIEAEGSVGISLDDEGLLASGGELRERAGVLGPTENQRSERRRGQRPAGTTGDEGDLLVGRELGLREPPGADL
jgi:hypothetical protein